MKSLKNNFVLEKKDVLFTLLMLGIITFLAFAICQNMRQRAGTKRDSLPVGVVKYKYHQVLRKFAERMIWEGVSPETDVYLYDSILTKEKSDATIRLKTGLQLDIDPNTMVEIDMVGENASIALKQGTVHADGSTDKNAIITAADGSKINITNSKAKITSDESGVDVAVKDGKVSYSKDGKKTNIDAGEVYAVDKEGKATLRKMSIILEQPLDASVIVQSGNNKPITFSWKGNSTSYKLRITKDGKTTNTFPVTGKKARIPLGAGTYTWQVRSTQNADQSLSNFFKVRKGEQVQIISPRNNDKVKPDTGGGVTFSWKDDESDTPVEFELAEDKSMQKIVTRKVTNQSSVTVANLKKGKYYWRARKKHGDKVISDENSNSGSQEFDLIEKTDENAEKPNTKIEKKAESTLEPAIDKKKDKNETLLSQVRKVSISQKSPTKIELEPDEPTAQTTMRWSKGGPDLKYKFQLSDSGSFKKPKTSQKTSLDSIPVKGLTPGKYYWKVQIFDKKYAKLLGETGTRTLTVTRKPLPKPPKVTSVIADE